MKVKTKHKSKASTSIFFHFWKLFHPRHLLIFLENPDHDFFSWLAEMCFVRFCLLEKGLLHLSHMNFLIPRCTENTCVFKLVFLTKVFSHDSHLNCFVLLCTANMWLFKSPFLANALDHESHSKSFLISWTSETCLLRSLLIENDWAQLVLSCMIINMRMLGLSIESAMNDNQSNCM